MLLRAVVAVTDREHGGSVLELARVDVEVTDAGWSLTDHASSLFMPGTCTPGDVASIIWRGNRPDALVGHGVPECQHVFAPALTAGIPWIDTHVLGRSAWPGNQAFDPVRLLEGCGVELHPQPGLCRSAAQAEMVATLAAAMVGDPEVGALQQEAADPLGRLVALSRREVAPFGHPPGPWETDEAWGAVPTSSLRYLASAPGASDWEGEAATRELMRRSRAVLIGPLG